MIELQRASNLSFDRNVASDTQINHCYALLRAGDNAAMAGRHGVAG
jgi:hypothetical protein